MRIVAGEWGGRRLRAPTGRETRPTGERVREALFSMLGPLDEARVLDLYAGSGALGLESLSRGASRADLVEHDRRAVDAVRANVAALAVPAGRVRVLRRDALRHLEDAARDGEAYDLVLLDPPYRDAPRLAPRLAAALPPVLAPGARVVVETDRRAPLDVGLPMETERRHGDTVVRIHRAPEPA